MIMELNIGLDVLGQENTAETRATRAGKAIATLSAFLESSAAFVTTYAGPDGEVTEHGLFLRLNVNKLFSVVRHVYKLATALEQECIACFYPGRGTGLLVGPLADKWGGFNAEFFRRCNLEAERLAA